MAGVALDEASRIRTTQAAIAKINGSPSAEQIRKAEVFEDIANLIFAIQPVREPVLKILAPVLAAMRTASQYPKQEPEPAAPAPDENDNDSN
jgi:hypothetical protein